MDKKTYKLDDEYSLEVVTDIDRFHSLRSEWDNLLTNHKSHVPFLCFDWFKIWLDHFLKENKLLILLLHKEERVVAIAPFIICSESFRGIIKVRKVLLIGNVHSPIRNFIFSDFSNEAREEYASLIFTFLRDQFKEWDVIELDSIPEEYGSFEALSSAINWAGLKNKGYFCFGDWYLDGVNCSGNEYINKLPKKVKNEIKRRKKRLEETGSLKLEIGTDEINFDHHMDIYYQVRTKSWKSPENDSAFHKDIRKMAAIKGWLRCGFLFFNNTPIAAQIRLVSNKIVYFMEALYDEEYKKFSPGTILRSELTKHFIDKDYICEIDQGRGDEPYKKDWTPNRRERKGITVFDSTIRGQSLAFLMTKVLPVIEKNQYLLSAKNKISGYLKNYRQR